MPFIILDVQLLVQGILYLTLVFLGLAISIPLGVTLSNFNGDCILYADISWKNGTYFTFTLTDYHNCNFGIYLSVICGVLYGLGMALYHGYALSRKDPNIGSQMWVMPFIMVNTLITFLLFISSCMISVGFKTFCDRLLRTPNKLLKSCVQGQDPKIVNWNLSGGNKYYGGSYYTMLTASQTCAWLSVLVWAVLVALGILRFIRNRRLRSKNEYTESSPSVDSTTNSKTPADLENFASVQPSA